MLQIFARMMLAPMVAVIIGGVVLRAIDRHGAGQQRHLDMAAICGMPAITLQLLFSLIAVYVPALYQPIWRNVVLGGGIVWFVALLFFAARPVLAEPTRGGAHERA
jgi:hypothetical protein